MSLAEILTEQLQPFNLVGHLSFGLTALSLAMRDMLLLRILGVASGLFGVAYNYFVPGGPLWLVIFWLTVFLAIHVWRIVEIVAERRAVRFTEEERQLHATVFRGFDTVEFMRLLNIAERPTFAPGEQLLAEGEMAPALYVVIDGEARVLRGGDEVARVGAGAAVGEISFLQDSPTTAAVVAATPVRCLAFRTTPLRRLLASRPSMRLSMSAMLSGDLARKLTEGTSATAPAAAR